MFCCPFIFDLCWCLKKKEIRWYWERTWVERAHDGEEGQCRHWFKINSMNNRIYAPVHSFDVCFGVSFCPSVLLCLFPFILPAVSVRLLCIFGGGLASLSGPGSTPLGPSQVRLVSCLCEACVSCWDGALPPWGLQELLGPLSPSDSC